MFLREGQQVGHYRLNHCLGRGGMAEVWSATHAILNIDVALKVLFSTRPAQQARLLREGRVQAALEHPNILPVRDFVEHDGAAGLILPLVRGPDLAALLRHYRPTVPESIALFRAITEGVSHAHSCGLIHRDLKPGNVLLDTRHGRIVPRVADFGLVKDTGDVAHTRTGVVMGTLNYAAPEQLLDASRVDHRADLFSLGVVLVELLTGAAPFAARSLGELLEVYRSGPDLHAVPAQWAPLCRQLLAQDPLHRTPDCALLLEQLDRSHPPGPDGLAAHSALSRAARELVREIPAPLAGATGSWGATNESEPGSLASQTVDFSSGSLGAWTDASAPSPPGHNLPVELDAFIGRGAALSALAELLSGARLVNVLGPGGVGKTRLSQQYARQHLAAYPGGVFFVDLAEARTQEALLLAVGRVLDAPLVRGDPVQTLGHAIAGRGRCLVVLDNFEQISALAGETVGVWLARAAQARFIVTSRVLLDIVGEQAMSLEPLTTSEAVDLFVDRARARKPAFKLTGANRADIEALVGQLDGLPLAIELASARIRVLTPARMRSRMGQRFKLLNGGRRDAARRQATLRAAIDWSWDLLEDWEKLALVQCSVFEGGFTLEAAEATIDLDDIEDAPWPMDAVQSLVDKSLVRLTGENSAGEQRFGMLASIHDYAREKLGHREPDEAEALRLRHLQHYAELGEVETLAALYGPNATTFRLLLRDETDNLLAASRHGAGAGELEAASLAAIAACVTVAHRKPSLVLPVLSALLQADGIEALSGQHGRLLSQQSALNFMIGKPEEAMAARLEALRLQRKHGHRKFEATELHGLGQLLERAGKIKEAEDAYTEARAIYLEIGEDVAADRVQETVALLYIRLGRLDEAEGMLRQALRYYRGLGNRFQEGKLTVNLGLRFASGGQPERGLEYFTAGLRIHQEVGNRSGERAAILNIGWAQFDLGQIEAASRSFSEALRLNREFGDRLGEAMCLNNTGVTNFMLSRFSQARAGYEDAQAIHREVGNKRGVGNAHTNLGRLCLHEGWLELAGEHLKQAIQIHRTLRFPNNEANALVSLGELRTVQQRPEDAAQCFQDALVLYRASKDRRGEGIAEEQLGDLHARAGEREQAALRYQAALLLHREMGNKGLEGSALRCLGTLRSQQGAPAEADTLFGEAQRLCQEARDARGEGAVLGDWGLALAQRGEREAGEARLRDGVALLQGAGDRYGMGLLLCKLAGALHPGGAEVVQEAERLVADLSLQPGAKLAQEVAAARARLSPGR